MGLLGAYFANWAQYHTAPYTHTPDMLAPIAGKTGAFYYGFVYFCPQASTSPMPYWAVAPFGDCTAATEYELVTVDPKDDAFMKTITGYKAQNPSLKVIVSIGGWNFPSSYFSEMASTSANRAKFIASVKAFISQHGLDGVDIDWEYPCSPARSDPVKITCDQFRSVADKGGSCPQDTANLLSLAQELRAALGNSSYISIASQAAKDNWEAMNIGAVTPYIDHWHVMTYDYSVPDVRGGSTMSPNAPLHTPAAADATQMSIEYTVEGYLAAGVPASKIMVGIPFYGHTWYKPDMAPAAWHAFGGKGEVQGECCGPFKSTYGAKPGLGSHQCGVLAYNEVVASSAAAVTYHDNATQSDVAYFTSDAASGMASKGTWVTYADKPSIAAITDYSNAKRLAGIFIFDTSMDTLSSAGTFTYELMNQIADGLAPSPPSPSPGPSPTPSGCPGGSLSACMSACPSQPLAAYKACVADCAKRCPHQQPRQPQPQPPQQKPQPPQQKPQPPQQKQVLVEEAPRVRLDWFGASW